MGCFHPQAEGEPNSPTPTSRAELSCLRHLRFFLHDLVHQPSWALPGVGKTCFGALPGVGEPERGGAILTLVEVLLPPRPQPPSSGQSQHSFLPSTTPPPTPPTTQQPTRAHLPPPNHAHPPPGHAQPLLRSQSGASTTLRPRPQCYSYGA